MISVTGNVLFVIDFAVASVSVIVPMWMSLMSFVVKVTTTASTGWRDECKNKQKTKGKERRDHSWVHIAELRGAERETGESEWEEVKVSESEWKSSGAVSLL